MSLFLGSPCLVRRKGHVCGEWPECAECSSARLDKKAAATVSNRRTLDASLCRWPVENEPNETRTECRVNTKKVFTSFLQSVDFLLELLKAARVAVCKYLSGHCDMNRKTAIMRTEKNSRRMEHLRLFELFSKKKLKVGPILSRCLSFN